MSSIRDLIRELESIKDENEDVITLKIPKDKKVKNITLNYFEENKDGFDILIEIRNHLYNLADKKEYNFLYRWCIDVLKNEEKSCIYYSELFGVSINKIDTLVENFRNFMKDRM